VQHTPQRTTSGSGDPADSQLADFATKVREFRKTRGLSQAILAENAGLDRKTISRIENSRYSPSLTSLFAIAKALDVEPKELL
jgi:transcriptional regulator with XRE-family HTH domain